LPSCSFKADSSGSVKKTHCNTVLGSKGFSFLLQWQSSHVAARLLSTRNGIRTTVGFSSVVRDEQHCGRLAGRSWTDGFFSHVLGDSIFIFLGLRMRQDRTLQALHTTVFFHTCCSALRVFNHNQHHTADSTVRFDRYLPRSPRHTKKRTNRGMAHTRRMGKKLRLLRTPHRNRHNNRIDSRIPDISLRIQRLLHPSALQPPEPHRLPSRSRIRR